MMTYTMEKIKTVCKKGVEKDIGNIKFKILDSKMHGGATQVTVEITKSEGRGNAIIDFWGPNKRKECTIFIKKSREHDEVFVNNPAKQVVQPLLDCLISGKTIDNLFSKAKKKKVIGENRRNHSCDVCSKNFTSHKYLKVHKTKIHTAHKNKCQHCEYSDQDKIKLREHKGSMHKTVHNESIQSTKTTTAENVPDENLTDLERVSWEEQRIDEQLMDVNDTKKEEDSGSETNKDEPMNTDVTDTDDMNENDSVDAGEQELLERSKYRDQQIMDKQKKSEEIEERNKLKNEESERNKCNQSKSSKRRRKRKKISMGEDEVFQLPENMKRIPDNIKHFTNKDDLILKFEAYGASFLNTGSA